MMQTTTDQTDAERNAEWHAETVLEMYRAYKTLEDGAETAIAEGDEYTDVDAIRERVFESALTVEVRGPWHTPGDSDSAKPDEFKILLTWGGPALRVRGKLNWYGEVDSESSWMQVQNWFEPWTDYTPDAANADDWDEAWQWFLLCFYFGE
jgi:hypothetical protein